ncbi:MAG: GIY-YIG nuclease family protein [Candidatus Atribacteria bacterium]|nr:MAG: GIY-YIG nuclease family protein [Candidatus Atribacteria bacterium]
MNKKELKKQYKQTVLPMGVFQVKNLTNGKIFIDSGLNRYGKINGCKFQLSFGSHMNRALQEDFNQTGVTNFSFEMIDYLKPKEDIQMDYTDDLKMLEEMWIEKLQPFDERGYNQRKIIK